MEGLNVAAIDFAIALAALVVAVMVWRQRRTHSRHWGDEPAAITAAAPPQLKWLSAEQQARWQLQTQRFLHEKRFIGCAGLSLTEAHRRTIAGLACLLRLQQNALHEALFPMVREVLLYPDAFLVPPPRETVSEHGLELVDDAPDERIGEHAPGQVVLSWSDVEAALEGDSVNVVIHEFAHALDSENPDTEGAPPMADYRDWSAVMAQEFARLRRHRRPPVLDPYGAQSPAEFWCVVAEAFFQQPAALEKHHTALFRLLTAYFEITPAVGEHLAPTLPAA